MKRAQQIRTSFPAFVGLLLLTGLLSLVQPAQAIWPQQFGGELSDLAHASVVDSNGNTFLTGEYSGTVSFGDIELSSEGLSDIFVAKVNASGSVIWAVSAGSSSVDRGLTLTVDDTGRVYVAGIFSGDATFRTDLGADVNLPGCTGSCAPDDPYGDLFVARLDQDGKWLWARQAGTPGQTDEPTAIEILPGNPLAVPPTPDGVIVGGRSACPVFYQENGDEVAGNLDVVDCDALDASILLAKLDTNGNWQWARHGAGIEIADLVVDRDQDEIIVTGAHDKNAFLEPGGVNLIYDIPDTSTTYELDFNVSHSSTSTLSTLCLQHNVAAQLCRFDGEIETDCNTIYQASSNQPSWQQVTHTIPGDLLGSNVRLRWDISSPIDIAAVCFYGALFFLDDLVIRTDSGDEIYREPFMMSSYPPGWQVDGYDVGIADSQFLSAPYAAYAEVRGLYGRQTATLSSPPIALPSTRANSFIAKLSDVSSSPTWSWAEALPNEVSVNRLLGTDDGFMVTTGTALDTVDLAAGVPVDAGTFAARFDATGTQPIWQWAESQGSVVITDLANDPASQDSLYIGGHGPEKSMINQTYEGPPLGVTDETGFSSPLSISSTDFVHSVRVSLTIYHTWRGDLAVDLESPSGTIVRLHNYTGGSADDVIATYPEPTSPDGPGTLEDFVGEVADGLWTLHVSDRFPTEDDGQLTEWSIIVETCEVPSGCESEVPDFFVRKIATADGSEDWTATATGNGERQVAGLGAAKVGGPGAERQKIFLTGSLSSFASFGDTIISSRGATDAFIAQLDASTREWFNPTFNNYLVGQEIIPPPDANLEDDTLSFPEIRLAGGGNPSDYFLWVTTETPKLYAIWPVRAEILWKVDLDPASEARTDPQFVDVKFPDGYCDRGNVNGACRQAHIAGAPAEIDPAGNPITFQKVHVGPAGAIHGEDSGMDRAADAAAEDLKIFNANDSGMSVLIYANHASDTNIHINGPVFEIVETIAYNDPDQERYQTALPCVIGQEIDHPDHEQVGRPGYVLFEKAFYDGSGSDAAYTRNNRQGQLFAVNEFVAGSDFGAPMAVAWYQENPLHAEHYWPVNAAEYNCTWPTSPPEIVIASQKGSDLEGSALNDAVYVDKQIYDQPDPSLPGFNPNDEHALFAPSQNGTGFSALFAMRADFGDTINDASKPYSLLKYRDAETNLWKFEVFKVTAFNDTFEDFDFPQDGQLPIEAGTAISAPYPLRLMDACPQESGTAAPGICDPNATVQGTCATSDSREELFQDYKGANWAKAAGRINARYYYPLQEGFYFKDRDASKIVGDCVPWMDELPTGDGGTPAGEPINVGYNITWPNDAPLLAVGETLLEPKNGLPDIFNQLAVQIIYDQSDPSFTDASVSLAQIIDPLSPRSVHLEELPDGLAAKADGTVMRLVSRDDGTEKVTFDLQQRLAWDPATKQLSFEGLYDAREAGDPLLLLNVMTNRERNRIKKLVTDDPATCSSEFCQAVDNLFVLTRNPQQIDIDGQPGIDRPDELGDPLLIGLQDNLGEDTDDDGEPNPDGVPEPLEVAGFQPALTAGYSSSTGYLTLAFNNDESLNPLPVSVNVIRVGCIAPGGVENPYVGVIKQVAAESVYDEQLTLRHVGDFGGYADRIEFKWWSHPSEGGTPPDYLPGGAGDPDVAGWSQINPGAEIGAIDQTIAGADIKTLSDNWFFVQYRGLPACSNDATYSIAAGDPGATPTDPRPKLGEGWVKRVVKGLNPFETRVKDFHEAPTETYASMLVALGERYEGDIPFNPEADAINGVGMIEAYETVLRRAMTLSIDSAPPVDYGPVNDALLFITSRLSDFYMLIGNEAFADAADPMIGFGTDGLYGTLAPTIFTFQNQVPSLLDEEVALLRGRDDSSAGIAANPVYNRLFWNFTTGDGEIAYAQSYNITDQDQTRLGAPGTDGVIDEFDARIMFPMGHGDAWGHYLMAIKMYYRLLRHPSYSWLSRAEGINVAGAALQVDFLDERKFAKAAAARAQTGAKLVDLTYRQYYVDDPVGQWQGYRDPDEERSWGVSGWARRAGQGAYFDWVVGNALLPEEDDNPAHMGISKVDRSTVRELDEVRSHFADIQSRVDQADQGLNPIGLAKGVVPFDIDPALVGNSSNRTTHFEQVYQRALTALKNATAAYDYANQLTEMLRRNQDSITDFANNADDQEGDFNNRLIEIFGYPYSGDIGAGKTYPAGYDGPDLQHFMWVDETGLTGTRDSAVAGIETEVAGLPGNIGFSDFNSAACAGATDPENSCSLQDIPAESRTVSHTIVDRQQSFGFPGMIKDPSVTGSRRANGDLQDHMSEILVAINSYEQAIRGYENLRADIYDQLDIIEANHDLARDRMSLMNNERNTITDLNISLAVLDAAAATARHIADGIEAGFETAAQCVPRSLVVGFSNGGDLLSGVRCGLLGASSGLATGLRIGASAGDAAILGLEIAKEDIGLSTAIEIQAATDDFEALQQVKVLEALFREEPLLRLELEQRREVIQQSLSGYARSLAEGQRTVEDLVAFRRAAAADIQKERYEDMAFRIFRNDALQKYQASFDLAARYVYLAAAAYDYETNLLGSDQNAGQEFLTDIVRERSLGQMLNGEPVSGSGLADVMARLSANFDVLKGQLGFNNPQNETTRFSLREENFRRATDESGDFSWSQLLTAQKVENLWDVPEFRRYARPFAPESAGPQPGLVIPFSTTVTFGQNFFGWPLGPGDSAYDPTNFATKINSVGVWFEGYDDLPLSSTPRVYLIPVGADVLRSPTANDFATREWSVVDQKIPVPLPISTLDLSDPGWIPKFDSVVGGFSEIRQFSSFRAYEFSEPLNTTEVSPDSRLIGRSVWNTKWLLIIPGGTLLADPEEGLETFIAGAPIPGSPTERDGNGVSDIKVLFQTYGYSGN